MSKDEKKKFIETTVKKLNGMDEDEKMLVVGYQLGKHEERRKWEREQGASATA